MNDFGILLRGKSLEQLRLIKDNFQHCFIVNDWKKEIEIFSDDLKGKYITQFSNSMHECVLSKEQYKRFGIEKVIFAFSEKMIPERKRDIISHYKSKGLITIFLKEAFESIAKNIRNTGVLSIFYAAEILKAKNIWIVGLEFYKEPYLIKPNYPHQIGKVKKIKLQESFIEIVKNNPETSFYLVTYYKDLPLLSNLHIVNSE